MICNLVMARRFGVLLIGLLIFSAIGSVQTASALADPLCDGWTLHTRTLPTICPEVVIEGLSGLGVTAIGALAFDSQGALYISRPATGEVLRLTPDSQHLGKFLPPEKIVARLEFPYGIACADNTCYVATATKIIRLTDQVPIVANLVNFMIHPLHIDRGRRLWTASGNTLISVNLDGTDERISAAWKSPIVDFGWTSAGNMWASDGDSRVQSNTTDSAIPSIALSPDSAPGGMAFYPDQTGSAFPSFANGLLVATAGSWNTVVVTGYELWLVPFSAEQPGTPQLLIPADTDQKSSNAVLYLLTFFPDHPVAVAISPQGWIYVATREGRIVRLRPR